MIGFDLNKTKRHFTEMLARQFPRREAEQLMRILLEDLFGVDLKRQLLEPDMRLDELQHARLQDAVRRLLDGEPVQYVTGTTRFDDLLFHVDRSVLIPRPETEEMVRKIAVALPLDSPLRIWDVGTGSGCIAVALAKRFPLAQVVACDVSEKALETARRNAASNGATVDFVCDDVFHPQSKIWSQPVDLVVSNPPYVLESEKVSMERNVLDFEPPAALFVPDDDPLRFYRRILDLAKPKLKPQGRVWFEINEALSQEMTRLGRESGFEVAVYNDLFGKFRYCSMVLHS